MIGRRTPVICWPGWEWADVEATVKTLRRRVPARDLLSWASACERAGATVTRGAL